MADGIRPTLEELGRQIAEYSAKQPRYRLYATVLARVFKQACSVAMPEAVVQSRPKSLPSFAEKCVRKWESLIKKYGHADPVNQFTDLCGARVIAQTLQQVDAVKQFIEQNFIILERDDKGLLLGDDRFGYRDMHYLIQLRPERGDALGFTKEEAGEVGNATAEVQVRSLVQHAWADILHDRMYKAPLKVSAQAKRTGALLAAIMEEGERNFGQLANELDGMAVNYSAYARPQDVENEIEVHKLLLQSEKDRIRNLQEPGKAEAQDLAASREEQARIALRLTRMVESKGKWDEAVDYLQEFEAISGPIRPAILLELGHALCRLNRPNPASAPYRHGQDLLKEVIGYCERSSHDAVQNLRRDRSIHARALARLAASYAISEENAHEARELYRKAVEVEPGNPYYLADMLGFELRFAADRDVVASFRPAIRAALAACQQHGAAGTELPAALFTAGRLALLLGEETAALNEYAKAVHHCLRGETCVRCSTLGDEIAWLHRVNAGRQLPDAYAMAQDLMRLAMDVANDGRTAPANESPSVIIVAGGAATLPQTKQEPLAQLLADVLQGVKVQVYSGGTVSGVPGAVGRAAELMKTRGTKQCSVVGYIPRLLPYDAEKDDRYDRLEACGEGRFSLQQALGCWHDVLRAGTRPAQVLCIGYGGGAISSFEYRLALALGATVALVEGSGGSANALLEDPYWAGQSELLPIPEDAKTLRALVVQGKCELEAKHLLGMAMQLHARYLTQNQKQIRPETLKPWDLLPETYREANRAQAAYSIQILRQAGFEVRHVTNRPIVFPEFTPDEVDLMAELEHGRWNAERLRSGWRHGARDDAKRLHNCIVAWTDPALTEKIKDFDREAVRLFPEVLARAGLEVYRKAYAG